MSKKQEDFILMDKFDRLMAKLEAFEATHTQVKDDNIFTWWEKEGLPTLKLYMDITTKMEYGIDNTGITVEIITKRLVLLPDEERGLMNILSKASTCFVDVLDSGKLQIRLWFRGWKWLEKEKWLL